MLCWASIFLAAAAALALSVTCGEHVIVLIINLERESVCDSDLRLRLGYCKCMR